MTRLELMERILDCEGCVLHSQCTAPVFGTIVEGSRIAILGEAPGAQEDEQGAPFVGPAGQMLRKHLAAAGIDPDSVSYVNTVSCFPHGTPEWEHIHACAQNREDQLGLSGARYVLCVGKVATKAIESALEMKHGRGRPFLMNSRLYMSTYHPAAALRNGNYEDAMADDIATFAEMAKGGDWLDFVRPTCAACPKDMYWMQESGLTWCLEHVPGDDFAKAQAWRQRQINELESARQTAAAKRQHDPALIDGNAMGKVQSDARSTSVKAAQDIIGKSGTMRRKVYDALAAAPDGLTDDEIEKATGINYNSFGPRRRELVDAGVVTDTGRERESKSTGAMQAVWAVV